MVQKVGNRHHWEEWAADVARIANTHIDRITAILENPANTTERKAFAAFAKELRDDLNDAITDAEIIEMLAQHLITGPVFEALFEQYSFARHNPMSRAMQKVLDTLRDTNVLDDDTTAALDAAIDKFKLEFQTGDGRSLISVGTEVFEEIAEEDIEQEKIVKQKRGK